MGAQKGLVQGPGKPLGTGEYELTFVLGCIDDGRYANTAGLQELPDPISKLTWDNALYMSPKTAAALGIKVDTANDNLNDLPNTDIGTAGLYGLGFPAHRSDGRASRWRASRCRRQDEHGIAGDDRTGAGRSDR